MPPSRCGVARSLADQKMDCVGAPGHEQTNEHPTDCLPPTSGHLKFEMRDSFLRLIELMQLQRKDPAAFYSTRDGSKVVKAMKAQHGVSQGRRRPARIPVRALQIGEFKVIRSDELEIVAKFCYQTQKLIWQLCRDGGSSRIDISWRQIVAISACFDDENFETFQITVRHAPKFFTADRPRPGKFHRWKECGDFTNGFNSNFGRVHHLEIEKGALEKSYGKLLYADMGLSMLECRSSSVPAHPRQPPNFINGSAMRIPSPQISVKGTIQGITMNSPYAAPTCTAENEDLHQSVVPQHPEL